MHAEQESKRVLGVFLKNWKFGSEFLSKCQWYVRKQLELALKLKKLSKMPKYFTESIVQYRISLQDFFDKKVSECINSLRNAESKRQYDVVVTINDHSILDLRRKWVNKEVANRKQVHFILVMFYLKSKDFIREKNEAMSRFGATHQLHSKLKEPKLEDMSKHPAEDCSQASWSNSYRFVVRPDIRAPLDAEKAQISLLKAVFNHFGRKSQISLY